MGIIVVGSAEWKREKVRKFNELKKQKGYTKVNYFLSPVAQEILKDFKNQGVSNVTLFNSLLEAARDKPFLFWAIMDEDLDEIEQAIKFLQEKYNAVEGKWKVATEEGERYEMEDGLMVNQGINLDTEYSEAKLEKIMNENAKAMQSHKMAKKRLKRERDGA